ncbi:MAG: AMP-binding protein [Erythrobacter sp.]|nr:AMP-binding protein [Erythrobacter sp.]
MEPLRQVWPAELAERYRAKGYWTGETFPQALAATVRRHGDRIAVVGGESRWTYADLAQRVEIAAAGFRALGLDPGARVLVQLPNVPEFLSTVFGLFRAGLVPVFALPAHRQTELVHFGRAGEVSALVIAERHDGFDYRAMADAVRAEVGTLEHIVVVGEPHPGQIAFDGFAAGDCPPVEPDAGAVALVQISGGSTGLSKLIPRTHDDYLYSIRASNAICGMDERSVYLAALPVAHNFPMSSPGIFGAVLAGATIVMAPVPTPEIAFPLIAREGVTITGLVPPLALLWMRAAPKTDHDLSSLEVVQVGGAKFMPEAARRVRETLGCTLQQVFGMAEGLVNYTRLDDPDEAIVETQGRPISPDDEILILDDAGDPVPDGTPGHLLTRGPYTIRGYHRDPTANARSFTADGFYRTGDIVLRRADGNLVVQGRATDHINRAGEKISAEEVEDHLLAHDSVFDAAVVSLPDPYLGERSCAFIVPHGDPPGAAEIKAWMRTRAIAAFKIPDQIVFVEGFATTAVGKVSRKELRARLRESALNNRKQP